MTEKPLISHLVRGEQLATNVVQASCFSLDLFTAPLIVLISFTLIQTQLCKRIMCPQVQNVLKFSSRRKCYSILDVICLVLKNHTEGVKQKSNRAMSPAKKMFISSYRWYKNIKMVKSLIILCIWSKDMNIIYWDWRLKWRWMILAVFSVTQAVAGMATKIQDQTGIRIMISAMPEHCSTSWAIRPTGSWSLRGSIINL